MVASATVPRPPAWPSSRRAGSRRRTSRWCRARSPRRSAGSRRRSAATRASGRGWRSSPTAAPSVTGYRVRERFDGWTLLELDLITGRTHQIRVHLDAIGHPVAGDPVYGTGTSRRGPDGLERLFLHAWRLELASPTDGHLIRAEAPLPRRSSRVLGRAARPREPADDERDDDASPARRGPGRAGRAARHHLGPVAASGKDTIIDALRRHAHGRDARPPLRRDLHDPRAAARRGRRRRATTSSTGERSWRCATPGELLEANEVHGNWYGTPRDRGRARRSPTGQRRRSSRSTSRAPRSVKERVADALLIFVVPPSLEALFERLAGAGHRDRRRARASASATPRSSSPARTTTTTSWSTRRARWSARPPGSTRSSRPSTQRTRTGASGSRAIAALAADRGRERPLRQWRVILDPCCAVDACRGRLVEVAIDAAGGGGGRTYTYHGRRRLADVVAGEAVLVEFGRRQALGVVVGDAEPSRPGPRATDQAAARPRPEPTGRCCRPLSRRRWRAGSPATTSRRLVDGHPGDAAAGHARAARARRRCRSPGARPAAQPSAADADAARGGPARSWPQAGRAAPGGSATSDQPRAGPRCSRRAPPAGRRRPPDARLDADERRRRTAHRPPRARRPMPGRAAAATLAAGGRARRAARSGRARWRSWPSSPPTRTRSARRELADRHGDGTLPGLAKRGLVELATGGRERRPSRGAPSAGAARAPRMPTSRRPRRRRSALDPRGDRRRATRRRSSSTASPAAARPPSTRRPSRGARGGPAGAGARARDRARPAARRPPAGRPRRRDRPRPLRPRRGRARRRVAAHPVGSGDRSSSGTRLAVLAPLADLGLVIVDEEHDGAYKSDRTPRLQARDAAIELGRLAGARRGPRQCHAGRRSSRSAEPAPGEYRARRAADRARPAHRRSSRSSTSARSSRRATGASSRTALVDGPAGPRPRERGDRAILVINRRGSRVGGPVPRLRLRPGLPGVPAAARLPPGRR